MTNEKGAEPTGPTYQYKAANERETSRLAYALSGLFQAGTVVALDGDLGAGKTTFSKSVGAALGVREMINSPTFTLIKEYKGERLPFYHMDVYRITLEEAEEIGLDEYFYGEGVTLVEWASLIEDILPQERLEIYIETAGCEERLFRIAAKGSIYERWCATLKEQGLLDEYNEE